VIPQVSLYPTRMIQDWVKKKYSRTEGGYPTYFVEGTKELPMYFNPVDPEGLAIFEAVTSSVRSRWSFLRRFCSWTACTMTGRLGFITRIPGFTALRFLRTEFDSIFLLFFNGFDPWGIFWLVNVW